MDWDKKAKLANLLNEEKYEEAVELIKANENDIDAQSVDILISGFCLVQADLLKPILPILERYVGFEGIPCVSRFRIALAMDKCKQLK